MFEGIKRLFGKAPPQRTEGRRTIQARYDAAETNAENRRHWENADALGPKTANNLAVRRNLRQRARYEVANNSYAKGIVLTLANDTIGTGPRLQLLSESPSNDAIENEFMAWAEAVNLACKLRTMRMARADSGEAFAMLINNPQLPTPATLDIRLIETDQVTQPYYGVQAYGSTVFSQDAVIFDDNGNVIGYRSDGIIFDTAFNPIEYNILREHPGDRSIMPLAVDIVPARSIIHFFRPDRPGQLRGIPDITPALPLFAQLRRFTLAVIAAAETAADYAGILQTNGPPSDDAEAATPGDEWEVNKRSLVIAPDGYNLAQLRAEQPVTTYADFKHEILNEIARCLNMPFNVAAGNSSSYNYASGRLDHQTYYKSLRVDQRDFEITVLDRIFSAWLGEMRLTPAFPKGSSPLIQDWPHQWFWDGADHIDPMKEANAQQTKLLNHTTTLAHEYARQGRDWEEALKQRAKELNLMKELGLPLSSPTGVPIPEPLPQGAVNESEMEEEFAVS